MNEQEAANIAAFHHNNEIADHFEVTYRGGRLSDNNVYTIPNVPFRLIIYDSVTVIDMSACYRCTTLIEVIFRGTNVTQIGRSAFMNCSNLERIELPAGLLRVENWTFCGCTSLREIVIPASVQFMGDVVFEGCTSLESVIFAPRTSNVELGHFMFRDCSDLRFVTLPPNLRSIPRGCFQGCTSLTHLQLSVSITEIETRAFASSGIQAMNISVGDDFMPGTIILPPKLRSIPFECFRDCTSLTHLQIPESVEEIEARASYGSGVRSVTIPENVHRIDRDAFRNCAFLEKVTIHSTNLNMETNIFTDCPTLSVIQMYPWLWPTLFASMKGQKDFLFKFFRHYHTKIFDFETPAVVHRPLQRLRRDR
mmetsp:Transcript_38285/g.41513  ORF Transcript_38285/g.41513 Transcript_38285/m.41513 type:complete len:366 (-) Transcript_38285:18-1115(-)